MERITQILVVDDEAANVELLSRVLRREGYGVDTAANGEEALARIKDARPDLVLLDVTMPVIDGLTVCRRLREDFFTRSLPIIFVTARSALENRLLGLEAGVDDYITKPFTWRN
jgi:CheY-like chemotaxis protein